MVDNTEENKHKHPIDFFNLFKKKYYGEISKKNKIKLLFIQLAY